ncbi:hypothetical protein M231_00641 [Tremella mesenterica]|uniref:Uncharacterized protein n=1 Tax=Tremella mesenterica TaxID=5217 RepID=A0A4Q1BV42_TREME|nr:hypothetical protein M231_00641 [Tremella mesenterica]
MPPSTLPPHLLALIGSPQTSSEQAVDGIEEWILHRRSKGDTLFDVSVGLAELEDRAPPRLSGAFDRARYVTNVPQPSDLTPPMGPFPLARSASPATVLHHLLSVPTPSIEHSREVILEYVLMREGKLKDKRPGKGGKGTLGRDSFEEISKRLGEIEDGLRAGVSAKSVRRRSELDELDEPRKLGLMLILSLRMSLSYFTLQEMADQLKELTVADAERMLVQHIRRRVSGEGRWGVGKELEYVENLTMLSRRALRPAFRSAKARTSLPARPYYQIPLPAPSKSACIKLLHTFIRDVEVGGAVAASSHVSSGQPLTPTHGNFSPGDKSYFSRRGQSSPMSTSTNMSSPVTPMSALPPLFNPPSQMQALPPDSNPIANYAMELVSEYLTREKREYILKTKWVKSGRDQLGKDLGDIETTFCLSGKQTTSSLAQTLIPVFLILRRSFVLPPSPLPSRITESYLDILPAPPDPDEEPFREPTVQSTTAALYVNPRLDDAAALEVLEELIENEKEKLENEGASLEETAKWTVNLLDSVAKRFPDGSYASLFAAVREQITRPTPSSSHYLTPNPSGISKTPSVHRRAQSHTEVSSSPRPDNGDTAMLAMPPSLGKLQHNRSASLPMRKGTYEDSGSDSSSDSDIGIESRASIVPPPRQATPTLQPARLSPLPSPMAIPPLQTQTLPSSHVQTSTTGVDTNEQSELSTSVSAGWWDIVSAVEQDQSAPWNQFHSQKDLFSPPPPISTSFKSHQRGSSGQSNVSQTQMVDLPLPPGAEPASPPFSSAYQVLTGISQMDIVDSPMNLHPGPPTPSKNGSSTPTRRQFPTEVKTSPSPARPPRPSQVPWDENYSQVRGEGDVRGMSVQIPHIISSFLVDQPHTAHPSGGRLPPNPVNFTRPTDSTPPQPPEKQQYLTQPIPTGNRSISAQIPIPGIPETEISPHKSKLGGFGRSMSMASKSMLRSRDKDKDKDKENEKSTGGKKDKEKEKEKGVQNNPGKWNKDMVANIMGPPVDRK